MCVTSSPGATGRAQQGCGRPEPNVGGLIPTNSHNNDLAIPLNPEHRASLAASLDARLVHTRRLHEMTRIAHWNLRGPWFASRHALFDDLSAHLLAHADQLAERAGALGRPAHPGLDIPQIFTPLPTGFLRGEDAIRGLALNYVAHSRALRRSLTLAEQAGDPPTVDLLTRVLDQVETDLWFLRSHLPVEGQPAQVVENTEPEPLEGAEARQRVYQVKVPMPEAASAK